MKKILEWLLELLYPTRCAFCHKLTRGAEEPVCPACLKSLPYTPKEAQKQSFPHLETCLSPLYYEKNVRSSLLRYKFGGVNAYAKVYADFLAKCIDENQVFCDSITWVPISRRRLRRRGYDQARLLAEELARRLDIPCVAALRKTRDNPPQSGLRHPDARRSNVSGVYSVRKGAETEGKRLLLIDDIVTTGSTLGECAKTLKASGAASVCAAAVARSRK